MAGTLLERELTVARANRVEFAVAGGADDADLRRLLRENPMAGRVSVSLEREPGYFADADLPGETKETIVARIGGRVACMGSCAVRWRFVNGERRRVGYLGGLRLDAACAGRFDIVRRGYEFFRELQAVAPADYYFTSIAADNEPARRLLERGLPGMPRYEFIGELVTLLLPAGCPSPFQRGRASGKTQSNVLGKGELVGLVNDCNQQFQFAPCWSEEELAALAPLGLAPKDFFCVRREGRIIATAALWDQRVFKQMVIRAYAPWLGRAREVLNAVTRVTGGPRLPAVGEPVANAFVSHLAVAADDSETLLALIAELRGHGGRRRIELLTLGFAAADPRLAAVRRKFRAREYRSRLYVVRWPELGRPAGELDNRVLAPEVALL